MLGNNHPILYTQDFQGKATETHYINKGAKDWRKNFKVSSVGCQQKLSYLSQFIKDSQSFYTTE